MTIRNRVLALMCIALLAGSAGAQPWPQKPVRFIVNFPAGGGVDIAARFLGEGLAKTWAHPVVVENRPGAGGGIGAAEVARATPDGHTLLFTPSTPITAFAYLSEKPRYSPQRDFRPVTNVAQGPMVLVVASASPFKSVAELIQAAKNSPGKLSFGHGGIGSQPHVAAEFRVARQHRGAWRTVQGGGARARRARGRRHRLLHLHSALGHLVHQ